jgi:capsular polysaccharide biosynthesis protein
MAGGIQDRIVFLKKTAFANVPLGSWWRSAKRAGQNLMAEIVLPGKLVSRKSVYRARSASELTPRVSLDEFAKRRDVHVIAHPSATVPLKVPEVRGVAPGELRFCGPFLFYPDVGKPPVGFPATVTSPPLTLARLSDVLCMPGQVALAHAGAGDGRVILEASFNSYWERSVHFHIERLDEDTFRLQRSAANFKALPGRYLYLDSQHPRHYGHFLVDVLTLAWAYTFARDLGIDDLKVLTSGTVAPFAAPLLAAAGIPAEALVRLTRPVRCQEVLVASKAHVTQSYTSPTAVETWRKIRDALDSGAGPERVYISRSRHYNRRLRDEEAIEALFVSRGFALVHPQDLPIEDQITLWANARLVAGTAGSNMFGLAFQRRLERAFLINSPNMVQFSEVFLQAAHASETTFYIGRADTHDNHGPWYVDIADLEREIDRWLA